MRLLPLALLLSCAPLARTYAPGGGMHACLGAGWHLVWIDPAADSATIADAIRHEMEHVLQATELGCAGYIVADRDSLECAMGSWWRCGRGR